MGLFRRKPPKSEARGVVQLPGNSFGFTGGTMVPTAGEEVTIRSALRNAGVWGCQRVLVATIGSLPIDVIRTTGGKRVEVDPPPLVKNPSGRVSQRGWVSQNIRSLLSDANMYNRVVAWDALGRATQVESIDPDTVEWRCEGGEEVPYIGGQSQVLWPLGDFWHVPASQFLLPGSRVAISPTETAATSIGTSLAAERYGAGYFEAGAHPHTVWSVDDPDLTAEQAQQIKDAIKAGTWGRDIAVTSSNIHPQQMQTNPADSQFIELLRFEVEQACRVYGVPPSMVYAAISGQNVTYTNVSQGDLQFLKYSVAAWLADFEDAWSEMIALPHSVKFNVSAILRMDDVLRNQVHTIRLQNKTTTVNAVKKIEDEAPFEGAEFEIDGVNPYDLPGIPGVPEPAAMSLPIGGSNNA